MFLPGGIYKDCFCFETGYVSTTYNTKVVLLTDARSVLESLESTRCPELNALTIMALSSAASTVVLQWIPGHIDIFGNDIADELANEDG